MANEVLVPGLAAALEGIGNAHVYRGSFIVANSVVTMGQKEGAVASTGSQEWNQLRAPEITGQMVHDEQLLGEDLSLTIPLIVPADGTFWANNSPFGTTGMGWASPQTPIDTMVAIIPDKEVGGGLKYASATWTRIAGNGVAAATGSGATPKNALWIWRARISLGNVSYDQANGGKMIVQVTIQGKYAALTGMIDGHHLASWGNPLTASVTGFTFTAV